MTDTAQTDASERKAVLFVDDDKNVLDGLERMLRPLRRDWTMAFVNSGNEALEALERCSYDVLVTDMRMPGMNGVELMEQVLNRYPRVIRIALSGNAERDAVVRAVRFAHQYLAKPCEPALLKEKLAQAFRLRKTMENRRLQAILSSVSSLRTVPALYLQLMAETQVPEPSMARVGEIVASDPAMTAKVLQLINSAYFGLRAEISDPARAVQLLGLETIKSLVLSAQVYSQFDGPGAANPAELWHHGLRTARIARDIARHIRLDERQQHEAFTAGLLHDVGKLVFSEAIPGYAAVVADALERGEDMSAAEETAFGASHAEVGSYLFGLWGLPFGIVEAVAWHHRPAASGVGERSPLVAVHAANIIDHLASAVPHAAAAPDEDYLASLGLGGAFADWKTYALEKMVA
jgi:HD-like signal output (HDOD) protein